MHVTEMRKKEKTAKIPGVSGGARLPAVRGPGALGLCGQPAPRNPGQALVPRSWVYPRSADRGCGMCVTHAYGISGARRGGVRNDPGA